MSDTHLRLLNLDTGSEITGEATTANAGRGGSGLCVVEIEDRVGTEAVAAGHHFVVRHLERLPAGTRYPKLAQRLREIVAGVRARSRHAPHLYVDVTGHGEPVVDVLGQGLQDCWFSTVYFNHGDQRSREGSAVRLGKAWLVSRLKVLLQQGRLHLPRSPEAETLAQDLSEYEHQVQPDANDRYGAFRVGSQDDLVTALGLAVQEAPGRWYAG